MTRRKGGANAVDCYAPGDSSVASWRALVHFSGTKYGH